MPARAKPVDLHTSGKEAGLLTRLTLAVGIYLGLHLAVIAFHPAGTWGIDSLAWLPWWERVFFIAGAALLLVPATRKWCVDRVSGLRIDLWSPSPGRLRWQIALAGLALGLFFLFRTRTHLLGDGEVYLREMSTGAWDGIPRTDRAPLVFWLIRRLHALAGPAFPPLTVYRIYSMASGLFFTIAAMLTAGRVGRTLPERWITLLLLMTVGSAQIFFGYVENYALVLAGILFLAYLGMRTVRGDAGWWPAAILLGIMIPLHLSLVGLLPAIATIPLLRARDRRGSIAKAGGVALAGVAVALVVAVSTLFAIGFDPLNYRSSVAATQLLPLYGALGKRQLYHLISLPHLLDLLNLLALTTPAVILLFIPGKTVVHPEEPSRWPEITFIAVIAAGLAIFVVAANPEIGVFRDWDVLASLALPLTLLVAYRLPSLFTERRRLAEAGILLCGAAFLHTTAWVSVNVDAARSERRFVRALESEFLSVHAGSYGWETLAAWYHRTGRDDDALAAYMKAADVAPEHPRLWNSVASLYQIRGDFETARRYYHEALGRDSTYAMTWYNLSVLESDAGQFPDAVHLAREAIRLNPTYAEAYQSLGTACVRLEHYPEAIAAYRKAVEYRPTLADAWFNLGFALNRMGDEDEAKRCFEVFLKLKPNAPQAEKLREAMAG